MVEIYNAVLATENSKNRLWDMDSVNSCQVHGFVAIHVVISEVLYLIEPHLWFLVFVGLI